MDCLPSLVMCICHASYDNRRVMRRPLPAMRGSSRVACAYVSALLYQTPSYIKHLLTGVHPDPWQRGAEYTNSVDFLEDQSVDHMYPCVPILGSSASAGSTAKAVHRSALAISSEACRVYKFKCYWLKVLSFAKISMLLTCCIRRLPVFSKADCKRWGLGTPVLVRRVQYLSLEPKQVLQQSGQHV